MSIDAPRNTLYVNVSDNKKNTKKNWNVNKLDVGKADYGIGAHTHES